MAFATDRRPAVEALIAILLTFVLVWFGYGLDPHWPLLWFAPLPVLLFALRHSWQSAALVAFVSWLAGCFDFWHYFQVQQTPFVVWLNVFSIGALVFAGAVLLFRALARRGALWTALVAFPAAWVSYEYVRNLTTPHGTAGAMAYTQLEFLPFLQLASLAGPWGMSFVMMLFPAALALGLHLRRSQPKQAMRILCASLAGILLVLTFGAVRLALPPPPQQVKVGLIAADEPTNDPVASEGAETERLFRGYAAAIRSLAAQGARVVVLPEKTGVVVEPDPGRTGEFFQQLAAETNTTIVVGEVRVTPRAKYNQACIYAPAAPARTYDKHHLLPPFESNLKPGASLTFVPEGAETWGVAICKDMDFTPLSRRYGLAGVGLMLVPGWDFRVDRWWHGHIAVMRGVEDGFSVVRSARDGNLTMSDDRGRVLAEIRSDSAPYASLVAKVPATHDATLYTLLGDWFAWFALAMLALSLLRLALSLSNGSTYSPSPGTGT